MRRRKRDDAKRPTEDPTGVQGAPLEPIGVVERELTRPDGTKVRVEVPVYPPFRLQERERPGGRMPAPRKRSTPSVRSKRSGDAKG